MVNKHRWPIYAYETLSDVLLKLCVKKDPYTIVANVLFHCSDVLINNKIDKNIFQSMCQLFHDEYYKSLVNIYSNSLITKNGSAEFIFSPLNTNIVQKVSPRITNIPIKRLKSLLHESLYNFGIFNTFYKEKIDINSLLVAVGVKDYFEVVDLLRLNHKLVNLTSHNVDSILDYHVCTGHQGRTKSIDFIMNLINDNYNLDTLINHSNWSLERFLSEITKSECQVSFNALINALKYRKLLLQIKEFLEYKDKNTGLLRTVWGYSMRDLLFEKLKHPEIQESKPNLDLHSPIESDTNRENCMKWDPDRNCFVINLADKFITINNHNFTLIDSIASLNELFDYLKKFYHKKYISNKSISSGSSTDELFKTGPRLSLNVEYSITKSPRLVIRPSLLSITININDNNEINHFKIYLIDLFIDDLLFKDSLYNLLNWILSSHLIKLGYNINHHLSHLNHFKYPFSNFINTFDIKHPRSLDKFNNNSNHNIAYNHENSSLNELISSLLGINLPTITTWNTRPLSQMNLQYATLRSFSILDIDRLFAHKLY